MSQTASLHQNDKKGNYEKFIALKVRLSSYYNIKWEASGVGLDRV